MKKIMSLFVRDYVGIYDKTRDYLVRDGITPGAEWVANGEGVATRKYDGTCCMVLDGKLFKRYDAKWGKTPPAGFQPAQDLIDGHRTGWVPVMDVPQDRWHRLAFTGKEPNGTYELCGPKVRNNPENFPEHVLVPHGADVWSYVPRTFSELRHYLYITDIEGIVWHHRDGRMVKIKGKDFGSLRGAGVSE